MKVTVVMYDDCDVEVFTNEKDALQYLVETEIKEGGSCEEDKPYLESLSLSDWNQELCGLCTVETVTVHEKTPN